ncbi:MAG: hypothetical protein ACQEWR_00400 [Bacillota bacterium]
MRGWGVQTDGGWIVWHSEYEVIVGEQAPAPNLDEMDYDELVALSEAVMKALRTRSYKLGYDQGRFDVEIEAAHGTYEKSDQQKRDEVVEQAKEDVEYLVRRCFTARTEFIVNTEKRTVVSIRKAFGNGRVISKGIAKCAPNDCFNVHIGKAIALRRALGLEVPAEYLNVPQPTEVRDGDYVEHYVGNERRVVSRAGKFPPINKPFVSLSVVEDHRSEFKIVDDSRAEGDA